MCLVQYRPEIDGLRAVAIVPVILFHTGLEIFSGGFVGVDVFFVISGYLIATIILSELDAGTFSICSFYERRARRILPALLFVMTLCIPAAWFTLTPNDMKDFAQSIFSAATFSSNILFWQESGYFATATELKPLLNMWSLAVEEQYYIIFPIFMIVAWKYFRKFVPVVLALVSVCSFSFSQYAAYSYPEANFYLLPTRIWELLIGVFVALYIERIRLSRGVSSFISYLGIMLILISIFAFNEETPFPSAWTLLPTVGAALVVIGTKIKIPFTVILSSNIAVTIGILSYSLYLWHYPVLVFLRYIQTNNFTIYDITLGLSLTVLLSLFTYKFIEKPLRRKPPNTALMGAFGAFLVAFCFFGVVGHLSNGYAEARYSPEILNTLEKAVEVDPLAAQCQASSGKWLNPADSCVLGTESLSGNATGALVGDSHAGAIAYGLHRELLSSGVKIRHLGYGGCPPAEGLYRVGSAENRRCAEYMRSAFSLVRERDNIKTVILHSRWPLYFWGDRFDNTSGGVELGERAHHAPVSWRNRSFTEAERKNAVLNAYMTTVIELLAAGKKVVLVHAIPEHGWDIPQRALKVIKQNGPRANLTVPLNTYNNRNNTIIAALEGIVNTNLTHIYPSDLYCDEEESLCFGVRGGSVWYRDNNHLNDMGAIGLAKRIVSVIESD
jgi:peptidoglycan/LPS O-acetylase OafA/YrhL